MKPINRILGIPTLNEYNRLTNSINVNSEFPGFEDELAHALQYNSDIPTGGFFQVPLRYDTPGSNEYIAHTLLQPLLIDYFRYGTPYVSNPIEYIIQAVKDMNDYPESFNLPTKK